MISGWPAFARGSPPSARMRMSLRPPALVVVMAFTGRAGQSWADACAAVPSSRHAASRVRIVMAFLLCDKTLATFHVQIKSRGDDHLAHFGTLDFHVLGEFVGAVQHGRQPARRH